MKDIIPIVKNIYDSGKFREVVDTNFSELFTTGESISVEDFFNLYNELFLSIPAEGEFSHSALIKKSQQLINPGKDAKDLEIDNLQSTIADLQKQLLEASGDAGNNIVIKEHPRFPNGSIIRRTESSLAPWPWVFVMDQGYKRPLWFSGDPEFYSSFLNISGYNENNPIPRVPDVVVDNIPTGTPVTYENFNDPFIPPQGIDEIERLRITLDPGDVTLNFLAYDGDIDRYRSELERDFAEKTNFIIAVEESIAELQTQIQNIKG